MTDHEEVQLVFKTSCPQIVVTPARYEKLGYNLTHVQSGFFLLGPFPSIKDACDAATKLADLFPIAGWNAMGESDTFPDKPW